MYSFIIYNTILLFAFICSYYAEYSNTKNERVIFRILCFLVLYIPAAIRYDIGTDYSFYVDILNSPSSIAQSEPGFRTICLFVDYCNLSSQWLFVFTSLLIYLPVCFFLRRNHFCLKLTLYVLLFYLYTYNVIRNSIAISLALICVDWYASGKRFYPYCTLFIACFFHYSIAFLIPFFVIDKIKIKIKYVLIIVLGLFYSIITGTFFLLFNTPIFLNSKYAIYIGSVHSNEAYIGSGVGIILFLFVPTYCLLYMKYLFSDCSRRILVYMLFAYILFYILSLKVEILGRVTDIFSFSIILSLPYLIDYLKIKNAKSVFFIVLMILLMLFEVQIFNNKRNNINGGHGIYPYETFIKNI